MKVLILSVLLIVIDSIYLKSVSNYFDRQIRLIQGSSMKLNYTSALLCYFFIVLSLYYFIIRKHAPVRDAMILGWCIYFIYELTNKAIIFNWSWMTVFIDGIWGGILFGLATIIYRLINKEPLNF